MTILGEEELEIWVERCSRKFSDFHVAVHRKMFSEGMSIKDVFPDRKYPGIIFSIEFESHILAHMNEASFIEAIEKSVSIIRKELVITHEWVNK